MEILIIGAGTMGYSLARTLSKNHKVNVIEEDEERYDYIIENLDVGAVNANGASPKVLRGAITDKTDIVIAVTARDEVNIFACMVAKTVRNDIITMARVRNEEYIDLGTSSGHVDHAISPERMIAGMMLKVITTENLIDHDDLGCVGAELALFKVSERAKDIIAMPIRQLPVPLDCKILAIERNGNVFVPRENDYLVVGDKVTVMTKGKGLAEFDAMLGQVRRPKDFIIIGGGIVGEMIAKMLEARSASVKVIENDERRCARLSKSLRSALIINDDGSDPAVLRNENVSMADALVSVGDNEEENLLACLIGRHLGAPKVVSLYSKREYEGVFGVKDIDAAFGYYHVVTNEILRLTAPDFKVIMSMNGSRHELFSVTIGAKCKARDRAVSDIGLPERSAVALVRRGAESILPRPETLLKEGDLALIYAAIEDIPRLERMFGVQIPAGP